jgi:hypothetical protein
VLVVVDRPLKIANGRFVHGFRVMAADHRDVVFESVSRNEAEERPEFGDLADGELALADIGLDRAGPIISRDAEESHDARRAETSDLNVSTRRRVAG